MSLSHVPVYVVSGFLGAGKTTLVNRILEGKHGIRFAVIVNEFGEIGLDADLIEGSSQDFVKMDNGCLCCALNAELMETVAKLSQRDDFDAVLIETTGVADPLPVAWTFFREAFLGHFRFGGIITVVDALNFDKMTHQAIEVVMQVERGDYLYLAKTQLIPELQKNALKNVLSEINPNARFVEDSDPALLNLVFDFGGDEKNLRDMDSQEHHHDSSFDSFSFSLDDKKIEIASLEDFFENLPREIFRAKALFTDAKSKKCYAIHAVCGRVEFYEISQKPVREACVFIGKGFDRRFVAKAILKICRD